MKVLQLQDVLLKRGGQVILDAVKWSVNPGEHWAILGGNGSGKTSLLNVITGYLWPTAGSVEVLGKRFGTYDLRELRKSIGLVSSSFADQQQSFRPMDTALGIVVSGKFASIGIYQEVTEEDRNQALSLLQQFGCEDLAERPFRYLSQGERQRVLLARAWMAKPSLLILDEPCSGLDILAREKLLEAVGVLGRQPDGPTLLYVTHHVEEVLPVFSHVLLLRQGHVVASGDKSHILTSRILSSTFSVLVEVMWEGERPWLRVV